MRTNLEAEFSEAMFEIYTRARDEAKYNASQYLHMLHELGALETARTLINADRPSDGYTKLWELRRLDLAVEALVIQHKWAPLFEEHEIRRARERLIAYDYAVE